MLSLFPALAARGGPLSLLRESPGTASHPPAELLSVPSSSPFPCLPFLNSGEAGEVRSELNVLGGVRFPRRRSFSPQWLETARCLLSRSPYPLPRRLFIFPSFRLGFVLFASLLQGWSWETRRFLGTTGGIVALSRPSSKKLGELNASCLFWAYHHLLKLPSITTFTPHLTLTDAVSPVPKNPESTAPRSALAPEIGARPQLLQLELLSPQRACLSQDSQSS